MVPNEADGFSGQEGIKSVNAKRAVGIQGLLPSYIMMLWLQGTHTDSSYQPSGTGVRRGVDPIVEGA